MSVCEIAVRGSSQSGKVAVFPAQVPGSSASQALA